MARSPLMRWLGDLARQHAHAARAGIRVEDVRARAGPLTRRQFVSAIAGLGLAACGPRVPRSTRSAEPIAIVGGGIAGLTTALTLSRAGVPVVVYEAADRLGGRMHSERAGYWDDGQRTEWCGELIDGNHDTLLGLAREFELPLTDLQDSQAPGAGPTYFADGRPYSWEQADADFKIVREWIEARVPGGTRSSFGALLDTAFASDYGADTADLSALNLAWLLGIQRFGVLVFVLAGRAIPHAAGLRARTTGQHALRGRALLGGIPGLHGRRRRGRTARGERSVARSRDIAPRAASGHDACPLAADGLLT